MGKKIEEFTEDELLDTGKRDPMSVEEIEKAVRLGWSNTIKRIHGLEFDGSVMDERHARAMAEAIQPLTVQQGFAPDWSEAPDDASNVMVIWSYYHDEEDMKNNSSIRNDVIQFIQRPQQTRKKTLGELIRDIEMVQGPLPIALGKDYKNVLWIAEALGVETEVKL